MCRDVFYLFYLMSLLPFSLSGMAAFLYWVRSKEGPENSPQHYFSGH